VRYLSLCAFVWQWGSPESNVWSSYSALFHSHLGGTVYPMKLDTHTPCFIELKQGSQSSSNETCCGRCWHPNHRPCPSSCRGFDVIPLLSRLLQSTAVQLALGSLRHTASWQAALSRTVPAQMSAVPAPWIPAGSSTSHPSAGRDLDSNDIFEETAGAWANRRCFHQRIKLQAPC
jgi:hypothetical protein